LLLLLAILVVIGGVDFFPNSVHRITRGLAKQINFVSSVYDEDPGNLHTSVSQELGSAVRSHLIRTGGIGTSKVKTPFLLMLWLPETVPFPSKKRMPSAASGPVLVVPFL